MIRPLIIGQAPSREHGEDEALSGRSGARLAELCGLTLVEFLEVFDRANLVETFPGKAGKGDRFPSPGEARSLAGRFKRVVGGRRVVVLGFSTAAAFGLTHPAMIFAPHWGAEFAFSPHPSGVSRWWNDPENLRRATAFWLEVARAARPA